MRRIGLCSLALLAAILLVPAALAQSEPASAKEKGRGEYIDVTVHGTVKMGVVAIGAETTGATITAGAVTWELELKGNQHDIASKLSGGKAVVSGQLRIEPGVEVKRRFIVKVRSIKASHGRQK